VSRLLLFKTKKIDNTASRTHLFQTLLERRSAIMTEVMVNLNSVMKILQAEEDRRLRRGPDWEPPRCISRVADWEYFRSTVCGWALRLLFQLDKMSIKK
jgi:hypothetical protein